ncbi:XdhC family protein [Cellulomonas humilata]|uniref:Xanthine dehydrogenase accessory factor n=1 Tax=Cellulomonas humilata TaxID=144055 RepID=A0ABU0EFI0_9CELL|nr:XdhC/CoxI family protein [Cellulomonas humilata]MDQ0374026.1 xanthine dehydrogenase accessory factor [Cellulomonas humilata]
MLEIADRLLATLTAGHRVAVATVVSMTGSAPTVVGTSMAVDDTGAALGSVAGGCVEGALYDLCTSVLDGAAPGLQEYGVTDEDAFAVGLTCGGVLRVHARELGPADVPVLAAAARGDEAVLLTALDGPLPDDVPVPARSGIVRVQGPDGGVEVFVEVASAPPRMVVYGALEFSSALALVARAVGYRVTVCDARAVLATPRRHPGADEVVVDWPVRHLAQQRLGARDVVCVMAHDDRFDADLVLAALRSGAGYVGAMGSRRTQDRRIAELVERGVTDDELARLHAPIGLDIGASTPGETAVSVLAEVLASRTGATGLPLTDLAGPIHRPTPTPHP